MSHLFSVARNISHIVDPNSYEIATVVELVLTTVEKTSQFSGGKSIPVDTLKTIRFTCGLEGLEQLQDSIADMIVDAIKLRNGIEFKRPNSE